MTPKQCLFSLTDGSPVFYGDILYHPNTPRTGTVLIAQFPSNGEHAVMRAESGAVPTVNISDLRRELYPNSLEELILAALAALNQLATYQADIDYAKRLLSDALEEIAAQDAAEEEV